MAMLGPIINSVLIPALAALVPLLLWFVLSKSRNNRFDWLAGVGLTAAVAGAVIALKGWPGFPPTQASQWLVYLLPLTIACSALQQKVIRSWGRLILRIAAFAGLFSLLLQSMIEYHWSTFATIVHITGLSLAGAGFMHVLERHPQQPRVALPLYMGVFSVTAGLLVLSGSVYLGQLAGSAATAYAVMLAVTWTRPTSSLVRFTQETYGILLPAFTALGYFYAELSLTNILLLASAALLPTLTNDLLSRRLHGMSLAMTRFAMGAVPGAVALIVSVIIEMNNAAASYY